jgi:hypothetical protein
MKIYKGILDKKIINKFESECGMNEYFTYVGNFLNIENVISVYGILNPDFIEKEDHIFWSAFAKDSDKNEYPLDGFSDYEKNIYKSSSNRIDVERYHNNFPITNFFSRWESEKFHKSKFF